MKYVLVMPNFFISLIFTVFTLFFFFSIPLLNTVTCLVHWSMNEFLSKNSPLSLKAALQDQVYQDHNKVEKNYANKKKKEKKKKEFERKNEKCNLSPNLNWQDHLEVMSLCNLISAIGVSNKILVFIRVQYQCEEYSYKKKEKKI